MVPRNLSEFVLFSFLYLLCGAVSAVLVYLLKLFIEYIGQPGVFDGIVLIVACIGLMIWVRKQAS